MLKVGVVGSRRRNSAKDKRQIEAMLGELKSRYHGERVWLVSGDDKYGADQFAEEIAAAWGWPLTIFHVDWPRFGDRGAVFARNTDIANECEVLLVCIDRTRSLGDLGCMEDIVRKTKKLGKEVILL